jgi:hypothetical protein
LKIHTVPTAQSGDTAAFDLSSTPKSISLAHLYDTFALDGHPNSENLQGIDNNLFGDFNDSIFGFMDDSYVDDSLNWGG